MVRSAAAVLAVLILPSFARAQEPVGTHTVVDDDTLWDLAQLYYQNPFEWRVIWEANRDSIADPNLIFPDEVFVIPGLPGTAAETAEAPETAPVDTEPAPEAEPPPETEPGVPTDLVQFGFRQARPTDQVRTIFFRDTTSQSGVVRAGSIEYASVSRDAVYSAPWLIGLEAEAEYAGTVEGFAARNERASTIRSFDRVSVDMPMPARVGDLLQIFRVSRTIEDVGQVVRPTGVLEVLSIAGGGVVGVVTKEYGRIQRGDFVRPVPAYDVEVGEYAQEISGGSEAMIMGFAGRQVINDLGHIAFLDLGSDDGVAIGDEFILYGDAIGAERGALQVVGLRENTSSARILSMVDDVFRQGVVVRLARKMP